MYHNLAVLTLGVLIALAAAPATRCGDAPPAAEPCVNTFSIVAYDDARKEWGVGVASKYLAVGAVLFVTGAVCMATKRNALGVLMGIELVLNGANINFVAFGSEFLRRNPEYGIGLDGQVIALFVIVLAAAEAAVALAIVIGIYQNFGRVDVDQVDSMKD